MLKARDIMTKNVITVERKTDIYEAIRILVENNITGLPVVSDDMTLAGIMSEKDVLRLLYNIEDKPGNVEDYMTKNVVSFDQEDSAREIAESFVKNNFRRVPILKDGKLVGIISKKDVMAFFIKIKHEHKVEV